MLQLPGPVNLYQQAFRSLNYLQGAVDYWQNGAPFFWVKFDKDATWLQHNHWDHCENPGRFLYGTVLSRIILGVEQELPVEKLLKQQIYDSILPGESLSFRPNPSPYETRPGARDEQADQVRSKRRIVMEADLWDNRSVFTGLILNHLATGDRKALSTARKMVRALPKLALWEDDCAYFTHMAYPPKYKGPRRGEQKVMGQNMGGWISPLAFYFRQTGDRQSLKLAAGLARSFVRTYPVVIAREEKLPAALHMNAHALLYLVGGMARVSQLTGETELLDWARLQCDGVLGELASETGWIREFLPFQHYDGVESCETCTLADRIDAGIQLALAGFTQYWDDVQRCVLNYLAEAQFADNAWMPVDTSRIDDYYRSYYHIRERLIGAYVGWGAPNDLVEPEARVPNSVQNCCGPHGAFAVYQAWHHAVRRDDRGVHVNLAISRDSRWCTVISRHPASDLLEIVMKTDGPLHVRLPDWADAGKTDVRVNGTEAAFARGVGTFIRIATKTGDRVEVRYPQRNVRKTEVLNGRPYKTTWQGDYVVDIDPAGTVAPLFRRLPLQTDAIDTGQIQWPSSMDEIDW